MPTRPSLQDLLNPGPDSKCPVLQWEAVPMRSSLQDRPSGRRAPCPGDFEARGSCVCRRGGSGGNPSSNGGFGCTKPSGSLCDFLVVGVRGELLPLPKPFSCVLAGSVTTVTLVLHAGIGGELAAAMTTTDWMLHGFLT